MPRALPPWRWLRAAQFAVVRFGASSIDPQDKVQFTGTLNSRARRIFSHHPVLSHELMSVLYVFRRVRQSSLVPEKFLLSAPQRHIQACAHTQNPEGFFSWLRPLVASHTEPPPPGEDWGGFSPCAAASPGP